MNGIGNACEAANVPGSIPGRLMLGAPAPNPTSGGIAFTLDLPRAAAVSVAIYDARGARVQSVYDGTLTAGRHALDWSHACGDSPK